MTKRSRWLAVALVAWLSCWATIFFVSRHAFVDADRGFWRSKAEGNDAVAFMYHDAQVLAWEWARFSLAMALLVPPGLLAIAFLWRWLRARFKQR